MLQIDRKLRQIVGPDAAVGLTRREWAIIERLWHSPGEIVSSEDLAMAVWPSGATPSHDDLKALRACIYRLREKIETAGVNRDALRTVVDWGYVLYTDAPAPIRNTSVMA